MFAQPTASVMQRLHQLRKENPEVEDDVFDPFFTLIAYFNSLRELGGAQTMLPDRVANEFIAGRFARSGNVSARNISNIKELTSRKSSSELKNVKASLGRKIGNDPVDVTLTTNMFQVGIDIPRLGLMTIVGQPKSNSEYIQSSGRVGRSGPGLVISLLRSTFPRDQSHYENFREFHQEVYRHVDLTSTTPFSQRALDRGMATAIGIIARMSIPEISQNYNLFRLGLSADKQDRLRTFIQIFKDKLVLRETHPIVSSSEDIVNAAVDTVESTFMDLIQHIRRCEIAGLTATWQENYGETERNQRGWFRHSANPNDTVALQSFRDVAPEVRIAELYPYGPSDDISSIPSNHLLSHAAVWKSLGKDGKITLLWE